MNVTNQYYKNIFVAMIILILLYVSISLVTFDSEYDVADEEQTHFTIDYQNDNKSAKVRYKYILDYEVAGNIKIPEDWNYNEYLFVLSNKEFILSTAKLNENLVNSSQLVPDISDVYTLNPNEIINEELFVKINPLAVEFKNKIRFETTVIVERLIEGKWSPVYQIVLMERGPYYSLNKGPIEYLQ